MCARQCVHSLYKARSMIFWFYHLTCLLSDATPQGFSHPLLLFSQHLVLLQATRARYGPCSPASFRLCSLSRLGRRTFALASTAARAISMASRTPAACS